MNPLFAQAEPSSAFFITTKIPQNRSATNYYKKNKISPNPSLQKEGDYPRLSAASPVSASISGLAKILSRC